MSYSRVGCYTHFTPMQIERMKLALEAIDALKQTLIIPKKEEISITTSGSYVLSDKVWTQLVVEHNGRDASDFQWEWNIPGCMVNYSSNKTYANVRPITMMGIAGSSDYFITIKVRATNSCGVSSDWYSKIFRVNTSPGVLICPTLPCDVINTH